MSGQRQKSAARLQGHRKVRSGPLVPPGGQDTETVTAQKPQISPTTVNGKPLEREAQELWDAFWASGPAQAVSWDADQHRLVRWIQCVNELLLVGPKFVTRRMVRGSMGQLRLNPLWAYIRELLTEIERAEEVFGMNPRSRFRLGVEYSTAQMTLDKLTRRLDAPARGQPIPDQYREPAG